MRTYNQSRTSCRVQWSSITTTSSPLNVTVFVTVVLVKLELVLVVASAEDCCDVAIIAAYSSGETLKDTSRLSAFGANTCTNSVVVFWLLKLSSSARSCLMRACSSWFYITTRVGDIQYDSEKLRDIRIIRRGIAMQTNARTEYVLNIIGCAICK